MVPGTVAVVLNAGAGGGQADAIRTQLEDLFRRGGRQARITTVGNGDQLRAAVDAAIAANVEVIVAAGGDGTVSSAAGRVAGTEMSLGVIPLGTLNHFAKDLGLPLEVEAATAVVLGGRTAYVDVGEVNGRVFINNSSLGLYPHFVRLRKQHPARGPAKWIVAAWAALKGLRQHPEITVRIDVDGEKLVRRTPILFIGNNQYRVAGFDGSRDSLSDGQLAVYIVKSGGRRHLFSLAWKLLTGKTSDLHELELLRGREAVIDVKGSPVHVAVDGEVTRLDAPLEYRIRPGALRVLVPEKSAQQE